MDGINRKPTQDVNVPVERRSPFIPDSPVAPRTESTQRIEASPFFDRNARKGGDAPAEQKTKKSGNRFYLWVLILVLIAVGGVLVANQFADASITITPFTEKVAIDNTFSATPDGANGSLSFSWILSSSTMDKAVTSSVDKKIQSKSTGTVIIYNAYNASSQRLIANTRLESPDHKIYRIDRSVVVPGAKVSGGKVVTPGSIEAVVYADVASADYDIPANDLTHSDFTIPGFKGDPRYSSFYAKRKVDSGIVGGFSGTVKVPTDDAVKTAQAALKDSLKVTAIEQARAQVPAGSIVFPGSMILSYEDVPLDYQHGDVTKVSMKTNVKVFFFEGEELAQKIAELALKNYSGASLTLDDPAMLTFAFTTPVDNLVPADIKQMNFSLKGNALFVGKIDTEKIKNAVLGKDKGAFEGIIQGEDNVSDATLVLRPFWKSAVPLDAEKISVTVVKPTVQ